MERFGDGLLADESERSFELDDEARVRAIGSFRFGSRRVAASCQAAVPTVGLAAKSDGGRRRPTESSGEQRGAAVTKPRFPRFPPQLRQVKSLHPTYARGGRRQFSSSTSNEHGDAGVHTQNIERLWGCAKWRNKYQRGIARSQIDSYLVEFIWRRTVAGDDAQWARSGQKYFP